MAIKLNWDHFSDQPAIIENKSLKRRIYLKSTFDFIKILLTNTLIYPICFVNYLLRTETSVRTNPAEFFGLGISISREPESIRELVDELGVNSLLIRVPLADVENLQDYVDFAEQFRDKKLLINVLQDRRHVDDLLLLEKSLDGIFSRFSGIANSFQLGNAINRKKWAFFSMDEYLRFYRVGYKLRNRRHPEISLLGSSVIDFEYYFSIRTLFNFYNIKYDKFSSLLYVDRRGAPENTQMGLDLTKKIHLMQSILHLSPKSKQEIVITETNWPLTNTYPYAPTSEEDCVTADEQASYMLRYYILALASKAVSHVYWHQLIAPGYGLIDNRNCQMRQLPSYLTFKTMINYLNDTSFMKLEQCSDIYCAYFKKPGFGTIEVHWRDANKNSNYININKNNQAVFSKEGNVINKVQLKVASSPVYVFTEKQNGL